MPKADAPAAVEHTTKQIDFRSAFPERVDSVFPRAAPFHSQEYAPFSQFLLSNLQGGLGFFHGDSKLDDSHARAYDETEPRFWDSTAVAMQQARVTTVRPVSLFSHTPSRPFFPRGFLWDEGFHLLPIIEWDFDLAVGVLESWLSLMDPSGWIAREQILGAEARSKVPPAFQVQYPHHANPPTFLALLVPAILAKITKATPYHGRHSAHLASDAAAAALLTKFYPLLAKHYDWFRTTQAGSLTAASGSRPRPGAKEGYRWRGRTPQHCFASGLDDYPRADPPNPGELHVDALAWAGAAAGAMQALAARLGHRHEAGIYARQRDAAVASLDALHWDDDRRLYCDVTVGKGEGGLERVCYAGYVSLMPFLVGLVDGNHPRIGAVLDLLEDPGALWSPYGLRSLSRREGKYGTGENYWRGAVWINLNVLAVLRLGEIGKGHGSERERAVRLAAELREKLIKTVYDSWKETGLIWEQYSDKKGTGRRSKAFTGWSACVLLLMGLGGGGAAAGVQGSLRPGTGVSGARWLSPQTLWFSVAVVALLVTLRRRLPAAWRSVLGSVTRRRPRSHDL